MVDEKTDTSELVNANIEKEDTMRVEYFFPEDDVFDIALLLPFHLDSINTNYGELTETDIPEYAMMALEFYEGAKLALDSLQTVGLNINLHVYDTKNSPAEVSGIVHSKTFNTIDLIIGPVYNSCLRIAAQFAKRKNIPLVSPFSPSKSITSNNEYFIMVNPVIDTHIEELCRYTQSSFAGANLLMVYPSKSAEIENATLFRQCLETGQPMEMSAGSMFHELIAFYDEEKEQLDELEIEPYLSSDTLNLFIIPSFDGSFVHNILRQIYAFREDFRLAIFGMPTWPDMETMRLDYLLEMNTHLTNSSFVETETVEYEKFEDRYFRSYRCRPTENSVKGYDIFLFFGHMLQNYGLKFHEFLAGAKENGLHTRFRFAPVLTASTNNSMDFSIGRIENRYVHLLRYSDFKLVKIEK